MSLKGRFIIRIVPRKIFWDRILVRIIGYILVLAGCRTGLQK